MSFNDAMEQTLENNKYDELMGRTWDIFDRIFEKFFNFIEDLFSRIFGDTNLQPMDGEFALFIMSCLAVLFLALILITIGVIIHLMLKRSKKEKTMDEILKQIKDKKITLNDLKLTNKQFASEGNFREAIRYYFVVILWVLDNKKLISVEETKTNNQFKKELKKNALTLHKEFSTIVEVFNHMFFGHKSITLEMYQIYLEKFEAFEKEVEIYEK